MDIKPTLGTYLTVGDVTVFQHRDRDEWMITVEGQAHPLMLTRRQVIEFIYAVGATRELEEGAFITAIRKQLNKGENHE